MSITGLLSIFLAAILTNNYILSKFLGICPFLGVSKKLLHGQSRHYCWIHLALVTYRQSYSS